MIRRLFFSEMIQILVRESDLERRKVRVTSQKSELRPDGPPKSESNRTKKMSESDFGGSAEKGLKAFLTPPNSCP